MKKYIIPLLFGASVLFASCDQARLEIPQKGVVSYESFYQTDADAESALNTAYDEFHGSMVGVARSGSGAYIYSPNLALMNCPGDDFHFTGHDYNDNNFLGEISEYRFDTQNQVVEYFYKTFYNSIYYSNLVIDNFKEADSATKKRCVAEARVLRAYCHMMLAIVFDCPPLVDHIMSADENPINCNLREEPMSHNDLLEWCAKECLEAEPDLIERQSTADKPGAYRVTKGLAWTIAGKSYLFAGKYAEAKANLKKVMNSGKYALVPTDQWEDLFNVPGDGCPEKIFELNLEYNASYNGFDMLQKSGWMHWQCFNWVTDNLQPQTFTDRQGWGGPHMEEAFAKKFLANDGDSPRRKATFYTPEEFIYEVPWNTTTDGMTEAEMDVDPGRGIMSMGVYGDAGYFYKKRIMRASNQFNPGKDDKQGTNFLIFRYAEVLLMYAECCAQTSQDLAEGLQILNDIQNRAGSAHKSSACTLDEVKNEKSFEMWYEGCRWADQVRWGDTASLVDRGNNVPKVFDAFTNSEGLVVSGGTPKTEPKHRLYVQYTNDNKNNHVNCGFKAGINEHFPIPHNVLIINPAMQQNPGYVD